MIGPQPGGGGGLVGKEGKSSLGADVMPRRAEEATGGPEGATHGVGACAPGPERFTERGGAREADWDCDGGGGGGGGVVAAEPQAPRRAVVLRAEWEVDDFSFKTREEEAWTRGEEEGPEEETPAKGG